MKYISTRGGGEQKTFKEVFLSNTASNGGLYVPNALPKLEVRAWKTYEDCAFDVLRLFIGTEEVSDADLKNIIKKSYGSFSSTDVAPLKKIDNGPTRNTFMLELFHGPTLAFKDYALQLYGRLLEHFVGLGGEKYLIIGATSGDTGSAAIAACKDIPGIEMVMLHPNNLISNFQRRQMTTTGNSNVTNYAVNGTFDDCQTMIKNAFSYYNSNLQKSGHGGNGKKKILSVNSVNWLRIAGQIIYYYWALSRIKETGINDNVNFVVPTGNFGNAFAAFYAKQMGANIDKVIVATNENDILSRFFQNNDYSKQSVSATYAPSMDIQVASNFERLLWFCSHFDANCIQNYMRELSNTGKVTVDSKIFNNISLHFLAGKVNNEEILQEIATYNLKNATMPDPHTICGLIVLAKLFNHGKIYRGSCNIALATAHSAKFAGVMEKCGVDKKLYKNESYQLEIYTKDEKYDIIPNNFEEFLQKISIKS